jgi:hypothetical protein
MLVQVPWDPGPGGERPTGALWRAGMGSWLSHEEPGFKFKVPRPVLVPLDRLPQGLLGTCLHISCLGVLIPESPAAPLSQGHTDSRLAYENYNSLSSGIVGIRLQRGKMSLG